jgi:hypothetical protein
MLAKVLPAVVLGIEALEVEVEVDLSQGLPAFLTVGLPNLAVKESRDRVTASIKNAGYQFPLKRITVNLAPADVRKESSAFDLPIAGGILQASGVLSGDRLSRVVLLGELSPDGRVKPIKEARTIADLEGEADILAHHPPKPSSTAPWTGKSCHNTEQLKMSFPATSEGAGMNFSGEEFLATSRPPHPPHDGESLP